MTVRAEKRWNRKNTPRIEQLASKRPLNYEMLFQTNASKADGGGGGAACKEGS